MSVFFLDDLFHFVMYRYILSMMTYVHDVSHVRGLMPMTPVMSVMQCR
jgi:hypothetical protein